MDRLLVIFRHTFRESIVQPIYTLLIALGAAILLIFALLPFFTLGEDTIMFKAVSLDVVLILVLIATLFAASHSIYEEIEDRTMLTLMSKPIKRWQVLIGKYLGIIAAALLAVGILGLILCLCTWYRIPDDYRISANSLDDRVLQQLWDYRWMHIAGLVPSLLLIWMQISVLAAISVAVSTRVSLVVNLPLVILLYIAGNLTRFLFPLSAPGAPLEKSSDLVKGIAWVGSLILPYLEAFDIRQLTVYRPIKWAGSMFSTDPNAVAQSVIWGYVGIACLYALAYTVCALTIGMWSFHNRELGGAEG